MTSLTPTVRWGASIDTGPTNLVFVRGPAAARTARHPTAQSTRPTSLGPGSRPPSSNDASLAKPVRGRADGNMETQRLRAIRHPQRATALLDSWGSSQDTITANARRIRELSELGRPLRRLARRSNGDESLWCSWTLSDHICLVAAAVSVQSAVDQLSRWLRASLRYLPGATKFTHAAELVGLLNTSRSPACYRAEQRACLLRTLLDDQARDPQRCAPRAVEVGSPAPGKL